jgi:ABC-type lipoprotein export system ATPase subunit
MDLLLGLAAESDTTLVVVTHDEHLATLGDRRLLIKDGSMTDYLFEEGYAEDGACQRCGGTGREPVV